jgi:hypothetical protein
MRWRWAMLMAATLLYGSWIAWLVYEAATSSDPIVVSIPQVLASPVVVEGEAALDDKVVVLRLYRLGWGCGIELGRKVEGKVVVHKVYRLLGSPDIGVDQEIVILNLAEASNWSGQGHYIFPLHPTRTKGVYEVTPIPPVPRMVPAHLSDEVSRTPIYPANSSTRTQIERALHPVP